MEVNHRREATIKEFNLSVAEVAENEKRRQNTVISKVHEKHFWVWFIISLIVAFINPGLGIVGLILTIWGYYSATKDDMSVWRRREQQYNPDAWNTYERQKAYEGVAFEKSATVSSNEFDKEWERIRNKINELKAAKKIDDVGEAALTLPFIVTAQYTAKLMKEDPEFNADKQYPVKDIWSLRLREDEQDDFKIVQDKINRCVHLMNVMERVTNGGK